MRHVLIVVLAACGCAGLNQPMSAPEYRDAFRRNAWPTQTFQVSRPHAQVSAILRRRASECLALTVEKTSTERGGNIAARSRTVYKPTVTVTKERTELTVQRGTRGDDYNPMQKLPRDGYYIFLAEASPAGRTSTSVTMYPAGGGGMEIGAALRGWAKGDDMGCPDLTKVH